MTVAEWTAYVLQPNMRTFRYMQVEIEVAGESIEVERFPAVAYYCKEQCGPECSGRHWDLDSEALAKFPEILAACDSYQQTSAEASMADRATRRAESGYAQ